MNVPLEFNNLKMIIRYVDSVSKNSVILIITKATNIEVIVHY